LLQERERTERLTVVGGRQLGKPDLITESMVLVVMGLMTTLLVQSRTNVDATIGELHLEAFEAPGDALLHERQGAPRVLQGEQLQKSAPCGWGRPGSCRTRALRKPSRLTL